MCQGTPFWERLLVAFKEYHYWSITTDQYQSNNIINWVFFSYFFQFNTDLQVAILVVLTVDVL